MGQKRKTARYTWGLISLHWLIAVLVIPLVSLSFFLEDLPKMIRPTAIMLHKSCGLTILVLMVVRLVCVFKSGRPALPAAMPRWELVLARGVQMALYVFLIAMEMVGWIMSVLSNHIPVWFGVVALPIPGIAPNAAWSELFFQIHQIIAWVLIVLIGLHIAGALKHVIIDKDKVMESMLP